MNNFKPIETVYNGYRFRSRLEARWAVFFNELGIPYEYEKEGYVLEGVSYLPDFWLPEQDCFIEIKGQEPSMEERHKAQLLSLYTQKRVCVYYGAIDLLPPDNFYPDFLRTTSLMYEPPRVYAFEKEERIVGGPSTTLIEVPTPVLVLMQKLHDYGLTLSCHDGNIAIEPNGDRFAIDNIADLISRMNKQIKGLQEYQPVIESMEEEIEDALLFEDGWNIDFESQIVAGLENDCIWVECSTCGAFEIIEPSSSIHHHGAKAPKVYGNFLSDTPRLLAAYAAARSARFEFGEKGK